MALLSGPFRRRPSDLGRHQLASRQGALALGPARLAAGLAAGSQLLGLGAPIARADTGVTITS